MVDTRDNVFLGIPTYDGQLDAGVAQAAYLSCSRSRKVHVLTNGKSLLSSNCNTLYANALNLRKSHDLKWFAMLHADVVPGPYWLDQLIHEAERHQADMMSAVVAIKDERGISSTAISSGDDWRQFGRLTFHQMHAPTFPITFDIQTAADALESLDGALRVSECPRHGLLANTGCMVVRLDRDWSEKLHFRNYDRIACENGSFFAMDFSEDWYFSRLVASYGGKVCCTTRVPTLHGKFRFPNDRAWGRVHNDCERRQSTHELAS